MRVALIGLGKSGTTAMHTAIESGMPPRTSSLFEPARLPARLPENVVAKVLVNERFTDWERLRSFDLKIFLARDPRDRLVSAILYALYNRAEPISRADEERVVALLERKQAASHEVPFRLLSEEISQIMGHDREAHFRRSHDRALALLHDWTEMKRVRYEDFVAGHTEELEGWLGFALPKQVEVPEELKRVARAGRTGDFRHWLTPEDVEHYRPMLDPVLSAFGYEDDWKLSPTPLIEARHGSEYVRRLLSEQRGKGSQKSLGWLPRRALRTLGLPRRVLRRVVRELAPRSTRRS